jgi:acyl-homoserine-lactone acylase
LIEGDFTPLMGEQQTSRSPRTRQNATLLGETEPDGPAGENGSFNLEELQTVALGNSGYMASSLRDAVVERCQTATTVEVPALVTGDGGQELPAATVDVSEACQVLADWDGLSNLDSVGAHVWREFLNQYPSEAFGEAGELWADPFSADDPVGSPSGLAPAPDGGDPVVINLARAVQVIQLAGWPLDAPWGDLQFANRDDVRVPIHGGASIDGIMNVVGYSPSGTSSEPIADVGDPVISSSDLRADGYSVNTGTSFLMALEYRTKGPVARVMVTYSETGNRDRGTFVTATEKFSGKEWRTSYFTTEQVNEARAVSHYTVKG